MKFDKRLAAPVIGIALVGAFLLGMFTPKILDLQENWGTSDINPVWYAEMDFYKNGVFVLSTHNNLTTAGANMIRDMICNNTYSTGGFTAFTYIAIGEGSGGNYLNTALENEFNRTVATYSEPGSHQWRLEATFVFTSSGVITEAGVFNAASGGVLLNYQDFSAINLSSGDELTVRFTFTLAGV